MKTFLVILSMAVCIAVSAQSKAPASKKPASAKPATTKFKVGSKIDAEYKEKWYIATIMKMEGDSFFVHYDDYTNEYDEWLKKSRIRPRQLSSVAGTSGSSSSSTSTTSTNGIVVSNPCDYEQTLYFEYNGSTETVVVPKKGLVNKTVYNGTIVTQKSKSFGTRSITTVESYMSTVIAQCE